jgi:hypothetical protein
MNGDDKMKFRNIKYAFVALLLMSMFLPTSAGLEVSGAIFSGDASPGQELIHEMDVSIDKNATPLNVTAEVFGFAMNSRGSNIQLRPEEDNGSYSAREFLTVTPEKFQLEPGVPQKVLVKAMFPEDIGSGGRYALVVLTSVSPDTGKKVKIESAIQVPVLLVIAGSEMIQTGEITDLAAKKSDKGVTVDLMFKNTGNYHYKPTANFELKTEDGEILATADPLESLNSILPTGSWLAKMELVPESELEKGNYTIEASVTKEDGTILAEKKTFVKV